MSLKCYNHPEVDATTKCEKCHKPICLRCKKYFNITHGSGRDKYSTSHVYCRVCYHTLGTRKSIPSSLGSLICILPIAIFLVITIIIGATFPFFHFTMVIPIIILSVMLIIVIIGVIYSHSTQSPTKLVESMVSKEDDIRSMNLPVKSQNKICQECGNQIDPDASICPYCGIIL